MAYALAWQLREVRTRANDVANWPNVRLLISFRLTFQNNGSSLAIQWYKEYNVSRLQLNLAGTRRRIG